VKDKGKNKSRSVTTTNQAHKKNEEDDAKRFDEQLDSDAYEDAELSDLIAKKVSEFSPDNPRELKRFVNVFRFQYFLLSERKKLDLPTPSIDQLTDWIFLSLRWPEVIRWSRLKYGIVEYDEISENKASGKYILFKARDRLKLLEDVGEKCTKENKDWETALKDMIKEPEILKNGWLMQESLGSFFIHQGRLQPTDRLSAAIGQGLY
jgi:hypothetical protein